MPEYHIFVVSDGTGETATKMAKAALLQFQSANAFVSRHNNIRSKEAIREIVKQARDCRGVVLHTFAARELRTAAEQACQAFNVPSHDLFGPLVEKLESYTGLPSTQKPGLLHQVDDGYFERLEALNYTVRNDDNRYPEDLEQADIVLVGVSRTSKTPLSIYLAQEGWRVANIPLVMGEEVSDALEKVDPHRVVGLMITPERLAEVRRARLSRFAPGDSAYADPTRVLEELESCRKLFSRHPGWLIVDVTGKSVEEAAAEILDKLFGKERHV